jgi:hypothetical protein
MEARERFELSRNGFADHPLNRLGTAPLFATNLCPKSMPFSMPNAPDYCLFTPLSVALSY